MEFFFQYFGEVHLYQDLTKYQFSYSGIFFFRFTITDLSIEKEYLIDMDLSVCTETEGTCYVSVKVFNKYRLPKHDCDWNSTFYIKGVYCMSITTTF